MRPKWPKLASLVQKICTLWFQFFDAFFVKIKFELRVLQSVSKSACRL